MPKYNSACNSLRPGQLDRIVDKIKDSGAETPCSDGQVDLLIKTKIAEIDSLIRQTHTDMGGKHKYHISSRNFDEIGKLVKELLWELR